MILRTCRSLVRVLILAAPLCHGEKPPSNGPAKARDSVNDLSSRNSYPDPTLWFSASYTINPPNCVVSGDNSTGGCPSFEDVVAQCTSEQCTDYISEDRCWTYTNLTNKQCFCQHYGSGSCGSCSAGHVKQHAYYEWLNLTCADVPGWAGLPADWDSATSSLEVVKVGTINWSKSVEYLVAPTYTLTMTPPMCANATCQPFYSCLSNGSDVATIDWRAGYDNNTLYLDRTCLCTRSFDDLPKACAGCTSDIERTQLLTFYNATCHNSSVFPNAPSDWAKDLLIVDSDYIIPSDLKQPDCLGSTACTPSLTDTDANCTSTRWKLDSSGNCTELVYAVERACICRNLSYERPCNAGFCGLVWERQDHLNWLNSTCSPVSGWNGLPGNWTQLLNVQDSDLLPWRWQVQMPGFATNFTKGTSAADSPPYCPSTGAKIGVYAAVNAAIAVLVPVLGRRTVIHRLTFGVFGNPWSRSWLITGPISIVLQLASNLINAYAVTQMPGFSHVPIGDLTLLWCTRPRLAWLIVALLPVQGAKAMYFSVVASCLAAEVVLQVLGSYYMGVATNYARLQRFYSLGSLDSTPHKTDAQIMYAGSLLWLVVIGFAILAAAWSILRVNDHIISLGRFFKGPLRLSRKHHNAMRAQLLSMLERAGATNEYWARNLPQTDRPGGDMAVELHRAVAELRTVQQRQERCWQDLAEEWQFLYRHLKEDLKALRQARKHAQKLKIQPLGGPEKDGASRDTPEMRDARATLDRFENFYREIPATKKSKFTNAMQRMSTAGPTQEKLSLVKRMSDYLANQNAMGEVEEADLSQYREVNAVLQRLLRDWSALARGEQTIFEEVRLLKHHWSKIEEARSREQGPADQQLRKLKEIARVAIFGMFGCWVAQVYLPSFHCYLGSVLTLHFQWIWWVGYIGVAGDT